MNRQRILWAQVLTIAFGHAAFAQAPPDSVSSDNYFNTAMGTSALGSLTPGQNSGDQNTAAGGGALYSNTSGGFNTAFGAFAMYGISVYGGLPITGIENTAVGASALENITTGSSNVALGSGAMAGQNQGTPTSGSQNTAVGTFALTLLTSGTDNTAVGYRAMGNESYASVITSTNNTAIGNYALSSDTAGASNSAVGGSALYANTSGANNTAFGAAALYSNTTGKGNAAQGVNALYSTTTGIRNLGIGSNALYDNATGSYNVALGYDAGYNATGNDNIYINNQGMSGESQVLRLGTQGTSGDVGSGILASYIAGVATSQVTGSAVYVTASGQLGVLASSERFKRDVESMGTASERMTALRPVTFKLKSDPAGTTQYGLIAEEVAKVYPELVVRGADGRIDGVRYEELAPMLLNVVQKQQAKLAELELLKQKVAQVDLLARELRQTQQELLELRQSNQSLHATLARLLQEEDRLALR